MMKSELHACVSRTRRFFRLDIGGALVVLLSVLSFTGGAATYYVKPDGNDSANGTSWNTAFKTPNKGFSKAHNNDTQDTVIIAAGHYLLSDACACAGKTMHDVICGATGNPDDVILDGKGSFELVRLSGDVLVHSLTISNGCNSGRTYFASGVRVGSNLAAGSSQSIVSNCVITGCYNAYTNGHVQAGGAAVVYGDGLLVDSVVRGNEAAWRGAGVTLFGPDAEVRRCVIEQNISTNDGAAGVWGMKLTASGGMGGRLVDCVVQTNIGNFSTGVTYVRYAEGSTVRGNVLLENRHSAAGGTFGGDSGFLVTNCTFEGNCNPGGWAGGVNVNHSGAFVDTRFIGNVAGGAVHNWISYGAGGMLVNNGGGTVNIKRCTFANNMVTNTAYTGGGIEVMSGTAAVSDCVISNNTAWRGGGVAVNTNGMLRMSGTLLRDNRATVGGGLMLEFAAKAYLDGCTFEANAATNNTLDNIHVGGGGIFLYQQSVGGYCSMSNSVFAGNSSKLRAGGMGHTWGWYAFGEVVNCVFTNNTSVRQGGGLVIREDNSHLHDRPFVVRNSLFAFNKTTDPKNDSNGGGVHFVSYNNPILDSCTIVSNDSGHTYNGGVHHRWGGTITNCVIAFNTVKGVPEDATTSAWSMPASCYQHCCIYPAVTAKFLAEYGCINADPLFADAANGDFTLLPNSPCRNVGLLEAWMEGATDLAGGPRVSGRGVDMGCYELFTPSGLNIIVR